MKLDYSGYTADQLLNDEYFIHSELNPTQSEIDFWSELESKDETLAKEAKLAREFLRGIKNCADKEILSPGAEQELWEQINLKNHRYDTRLKRSVKIGLGIAASVALLFGSVWYFRNSGSVQQDMDYLSMLENMKQSDTRSINSVQLILSNDEAILIDGKEPCVEYKEDGTVNVGSVNINSTGKINASEKKDPVRAYNQLIVPVGKRSMITFHDGTKLWVNSGSKVIYPEFFEENKREIFVEGEVFLDVVSQENKRPFIVKTKQLDVVVLGTQFNVSAYKSEKEMKVVLVNGKVEVQTHENEKSILSPNQMFSYNTLTRENSITHVNVNEYVFWKDGYYQFERQKMNIIFQKVSSFYGVDIEWNEQLNNLTCSGKLDLKDNIDDVLNSLKKAGPIDISKNEEKIYIDVKPQN